MRSLRQADYGDVDKDNPEQEESDVFNGDDGDKAKTEQEGHTEQEGDTEQEGGCSAPVLPG